MSEKKTIEELAKKKCFEYFDLERELQRKLKKQLEDNGLLKEEYYVNKEAAERLNILLEIINKFLVENVKSEYLNNRKDHFDFSEIWEKFNREVVYIDERLEIKNNVNNQDDDVFASEEVDELDIADYQDDDTFDDEEDSERVYEFYFESIRGLGNRVLSAYNKFPTIYEKIAKREASLRRGVEGESNLYNRLKIIGDKIRIIQNARYLIDDDFGVEHDMIVISAYGIFSIEVKNWRSDSHINEKGYLIDGNGKSTNIIEQSMRHVHNLERLIQKEMNHRTEVHPLIVWVDERSKITNDFKFVTVCNYNDVEFELFNSEKYNRVYSEEDIDAIYRKLIELKRPEKKYELGIDIEGLVSSAPQFVAGLKFFPDLVEIDREMKVADGPIVATIKTVVKGTGNVVKEAIVYTGAEIVKSTIKSIFHL